MSKQKPDQGLVVISVFYGRLSNGGGFLVWVLSLLTLSFFLIGGDVQAKTSSLGLLKSYMAKIKTAKPLYFDPLENGVKMLPLEFNYDLSSSDGRQMRIGPLTLGENALLIKPLLLSSFDSQLPGLMNNGKNTNVLMVYWPQGMIPEGKLEAISRRGDVIWSEEITEGKKVAWDTQLNTWSALLKKSRRELNQEFHWSRGIGFFNFKEDILKIWQSTPMLRFCFSRSEGIHRTMICTPRYRIRVIDGQITMNSIQENTSARVLIQNEAAPLSGSIEIKDPQDSFMFFGELTSGLRLEFTSTPGKLQVVDFVKTADQRWYRLTGFDQRVYGTLIELNPENYQSWVSRWKLQPTLGDLRRFWTTLVAAEKPEVYLLGQGGGLFLQRFEFDDLPSEKIRPWIELRSLNASYTSGSPVWGELSSGTHVDSSEESASEENRSFRWNVQAENKGQMNKAHLSVVDEATQKKWQAFYEIHRAYPVEVSARLTGVIASQGSSVKMGLWGEAALNFWAQTLLGWNQYHIARQRWGLSAKYFQSLVTVTLLGANDSSQKSNRIQATMLDLKYRLWPGVWGRDETWGLVSGYQNVVLDDIDAPMAGVGFFWGRSMPKVLDDFFNILPMMRYPKYTDLEFVFYPMSLDSNIVASENWLLNFHGKVFWSYSVFGELGLGIKRYSFTDKKRAQKATFLSTVTTLGLGVNF